MENRLAEAFKNKQFVVTYEFIPGRGANEDAQVHLIDEAKELSSNERVQAFSITDNPSGNPALLADQFGLNDPPISGGLQTKSRPEVLHDSDSKVSVRAWRE